MRVALAPIALLTIALSAAGSAGAATLADVAAALAAPADAAQATNDWSSFTSLRTAQWKGKAPAKGGDKAQVRGACPDERMSGLRIYRVTLAGRKPLYLHAQSVTEDRGGSFSTFELEL